MLENLVRVDIKEPMVQFYNSHIKTKTTPRYSPHKRKKPSAEDFQRRLQEELRDTNKKLKLLSIYF